MQLFDVLGKRWTMRVLWELRGGRLSFRELRMRCENISPTVLNQRIKSLREMDIVDQCKTGYGLTNWGVELGEQLIALDIWAERWSHRK